MDAFGRQGLNMSQRGGVPTLADIPAENPFRHVGEKWIEGAETQLQGRLMNASKGLPSREAQLIIDLDLADFPELKTGSASKVDARRIKRLEIARDNEQNARKRQLITLTDYTDLFNALAVACQKNAPLLLRQIKMTCNMEKTHGVAGGAMDGPRAWAIVCQAMRSNERSDADKNFYLDALHLQRTVHLATGCTADAYANKAMAFIIQIRPNLPQAFTDSDTIDYLFELLPKAYRVEWKLLKLEIQSEGRLNDFMYVIRRCRALVQTNQKPGADAVPTFISLNNGAFNSAFSLLTMQDATGMPLTSEAKVPKALGATEPVGGKRGP